MSFTQTYNYMISDKLKSLMGPKYVEHSLLFNVLPNWEVPQLGENL